MGFIIDQVSRGHGKYLGGFACIVSGLMALLLIMNFSGLFPYVFSSTSHLVVSFVFASVL